MIFYFTGTGNSYHVAKEIARIKNIDYDEVIEVTLKNAKNMYKINS